MQELVKNENGKVLTSSLVVAEIFGKRHDNVLKIIENIESSKDFNECNFLEIEYFDSRNRKQKAYNITQKGLTFLVMGFTGDLAQKIKLQIIENASFEIDLREMQKADYQTPNQKTYIMTDSKKEIFKIGKSKDPKFREKTLQSEKPTITLLAICEELVEYQIHKEYEMYRVRGEWFKLSSNQIQNIISKYKFKTV